ncbi:MAG: histidinol dehydrogenase [Alphaproteobacteria bacterium CG11_big_fil_rev_8_21_14_0_20_44_7]|nr:MAG: histidinol dehydrogenase [Alphaproteobacteria bacterium CG11_big_fil_rev_8_21_14_0_20_44_7]
MRIITIKDGNLASITKMLRSEPEDFSGIRQIVRGIINQVQDEGDSKLIALTNQLDRNSLDISQLAVTQDELDNAYNSIDEDLRKSLELASVRVHNYYERQLPEDLEYTDKIGVRLGARWLAVESAGLYVPGGTASYPSSVIMNAIPARVAGVERIVMVCPAMDGKIPQVVLAAAKICGITEIYKVGGAQAVAALAYGTETIAPVDKIVGPGNAYVAEAKRQVFGVVGIDMIAGPSEILVVADDKNNPEWIAADLLSQAEHDTSAQSILITNSAQFAQDVIGSIYELLPQLTRRAIAEKSIETHGMAIVVENFDEAVKIVNLAAPEHLELAVEEPDELLKNIKNAGAVFLGRYTPEAIGDYIAGPSHVLPTMRNSRFSSGLSIFDFMKRQSIISCDEASFAELSEATELLANTEGLTAHALSISVRNANRKN